MKILGALLELPSKQHCRFGQFGPVLRLDAEYLSYVKSIETHASAFLPLNISAIGTVIENLFPTFNTRIKKCLVEL